MGLTWEAEVAALNRQEWRRSVAQYVYVDVPTWDESSQVCLYFVDASVSQSVCACVPMCVYVSVCVSVCLSVCSTAKMSSYRRRVAVVPRSHSSQSDAVKIRHFNAAPEDNHDCSFSTITLPFQCTYTVPSST